MNWERVFKFNPYHGKDGRFASANGHASSTYVAQALTLVDGNHRSADDIAKDVLGEDYDEFSAALGAANKLIKAGGETYKTHSVNGDGTGGYTKERKKLHQKILADTFAGADAYKPDGGGPPTVYILGGRGGSGKSSFDKQKGQPSGVYDSKKTLVLDPDAMKAALGAGPNDAATFHEESSHVYAMAVKMAKARGLNVALDRTLKSPQDALVESFKRSGYKTEAHFMRLSPEGAAIRAAKRWQGKNGKRGRLVPLEVVLSNRSNEANFDRLTSRVDNWSVWDNSGDKPKKFKDKRDKR